jgi:hypothetical protein
MPQVLQLVEVEILRNWEAALMRIQALNWFETRHLSKKQNGRHKQRSGRHPLARQKNIQKRPEAAGHIQILSTMYRHHVDADQGQKSNYRDDADPDSDPD